MRARPAHIPVLLLAAVFATAFASSCSRELPNAPLRTAPRSHAQRFDGSDISGQLVVTLQTGANVNDIAAANGATVLQWDAAQRVALLAPASGKTTASLTSSLATDIRVTSLESNTYVQVAESQQKSFAFDDGLGSPTTYAEQPAAAALHLVSAHDIARGTGVKVAVLDTGIDPQHPVLSDHVVASWDFVQDQPGAFDIQDGVDSNGDGTIDGAWGHGTHVAGLVELAAPDAQLIVGRVLDSDGVGDVLTVAAGIRWAVSQGAQVINLSLGTVHSSSAIAEAIEEARERGVIVIASIGNHGAEYPREYPARDENVIAVAASDAFGVPADWTSYATYVRVSAPGVAVRSTYPGGVYRLWSGSSMSVPFVAGTVAMLRQLHPDWSSAQMLQRIQSTTIPLTGVSALQAGKLGAGMLDAGAALAPDGDGEDPVDPVLLPGIH